MKNFILIFLFILNSAFAYEKVQINGKLYIPEGFDTNDLVEVTVIGTLPNPCYKNPGFEIERQKNKYVIRLYAHYVPVQDGCRDISLAYKETINFGMMHEGKYQLELFNKTDTQQKILNIKKSKNVLVDNFLYGNVTAVVENEANREIELVGINPTNCLVFDTMTTKIQSDIIVLQPHFKEEGFCENKPTPFKIKYNVPYFPQKAQGILLHVRNMNGRSFNYLFQNRI